MPPKPPPLDSSADPPAESSKPSFKTPKPNHFSKQGAAKPRTPRQVLCSLGYFGELARDRFGDRLHNFGTRLHSFGARLRTLRARLHSFWAGLRSIWLGLRSFWPGLYSFWPGLHSFCVGLRSPGSQAPVLDPSPWP
mgnify:CR=1 FL=1